MSNSAVEGFMFGLGMILCFVVFVIIAALLIYWAVKSGMVHHVAVGAFKNAIGL